MTSVFPIIATVARIEYAVRVKVVIPGGGWFVVAVDELVMFIFAVLQEEALDSVALGCLLLCESTTAEKY